MGERKYLRFQIGNVPPDELSLVSRQFKQELDENMMKSVYVYVTDLPDWSMKRLRMPQRLLQISRMKLDIVIDCSIEAYEDPEVGCLAQESLKLRRLALMDILPKFICLQAIVVNLHMRPDCHIDECEEEVIEHCPELVSALLTVCPSVAFNVLQQRFDFDKNNEWVWEGGRVHTMTYCNESKQLQRVVVGDDQKEEKKNTI